jgi:hypothetical protein
MKHDEIAIQAWENEGGAVLESPDESHLVSLLQEPQHALDGELAVSSKFGVTPDNEVATICNCAKHMAV